MGMAGNERSGLFLPHTDPETRRGRDTHIDGDCDTHGVVAVPNEIVPQALYRGVCRPAARFAADGPRFLSLDRFQS